MLGKESGESSHRPLCLDGDWLAITQGCHRVRLAQEREVDRPVKRVAGGVRARGATVGVLNQGQAIDFKSLLDRIRGLNHKRGFLHYARYARILVLPWFLP
jgi:hypothetical protein